MSRTPDLAYTAFSDLGIQAPAGPGDEELGPRRPGRRGRLCGFQTGGRAGESPAQGGHGIKAIGGVAPNGASHNLANHLRTTRSHVLKARRGPFKDGQAHFRDRCSVWKLKQTASGHHLEENGAESIDIDALAASKILIASEMLLGCGI